jgi:5,10-methylenetetrahydromethanopterin reductase
MGASGAAATPLGFGRAKPAVAIREAIEVIRRLLRSEHVSFDGQVIHLHGAKLDFPTRADLPIYVASRGNLVLKMAGEVADGVMVASYATPAGLQHALTQITQGVRRAGRDLRKLTLISRVDACIDADGDAAREAVRPMVARLVGSSYPDIGFLNALGLAIPKELETVIAKRDHALTSASAHLLPDSFVDALTWAGTPEEVARKVSDVVRLGFDHITFLPHPVPGKGPEEIIRSFACDVIPMATAMAQSAV